MGERRRNFLLWFLIGVGVLLIMAGALSIFLKRPAKPVSTATPASAEQVQRVTLKDAKSAFDNGTAVFVDVRAADSYKVSHIPGALSFPGNELPARSGELDQGAWIIPY